MKKKRVLIIEDTDSYLKEFRNKAVGIKEFEFKICESPKDFELLYSKHPLNQFDYFVLDFWIAPHTNIIESGILEIIATEKKEHAKILCFSSCPEETIIDCLKAQKIVSPYDIFLDKDVNEAITFLKNDL